MADPWRWWDAATIARITGCPVDAVTHNWPLIVDALYVRGIYDRDVCLGVLPTVAIETASTFEPIHEYGTTANWAGYEGGPDFAGRGFPQLTHLSNYRNAGDALGIDLVSNPDLALDPKISANILAWFWATKGVPAKNGSHFYTMVELCHEHDWNWVRRVFQGGTAGLDRLIAMASALDAYAAPTETPMPVTFNPDYPAVLQNDDWSCAPTSLTWAMRALGRTPATDWIETDMVNLNIVSKEVGLLDHTGAGIVTWLQIGDPKHYGSDGYGISNNQCPISWDQLIPEINAHPPYPLLLGLPVWGGAGHGHWSGVRGYDPARDVILLANPATGATYGQPELTRQQFEARAGNNASIVRVLHPDLIGTPMPAPTPVPSSSISRADLDDIISRLTVLRDRLPAA